VEAVQALAASPQLANLRYLDLSCLNPSEGMLLAVLDSPHLGGLTELRIQDASRGTFSPAILRRARKWFGRVTDGRPGVLFTTRKARHGDPAS
jgi:hypothetical protein